MPALQMANGFGGFTENGREYTIVLRGDTETPAPWANVLTNPTFGTLVTASGAAFTWSINSREHRLTPFANDPVSDVTSEAIYVRDDDNGEVWGATPGTASAQRRRHVDRAAWRGRHLVRARDDRNRTTPGCLGVPGRAGESHGAEADQHDRRTRGV